MTITPLLYSGNKDLEKIQQIITSIKVANMTRQVISRTEKLAIMRKRRIDSCQKSQKLVRTNKEYFNYAKKRHYAWDYYLGTFKRKLEDKKASKTVNKLDEIEIE